MNHFEKVLVCVDLSTDNRFVDEQLSETTRQAIRQAEWVARSSSAELCFIYVLPRKAEQLSHDRQILMALGDNYKSVEAHANEVLDSLAAASSNQGIKCSSRVVFGKYWVEIIREVIRNNHDLVVAGTRNKGQIRNMLFGSTGLKLLRKCPCPVWITKPQPDGPKQIKSILVAHDLTTVGESALAIGCMLAKERDAKLHVLNAVEYKVADVNVVEQFMQKEVTAQIGDQLMRSKIDPSKVEIEVSSGYAAELILDRIAKHEIELVVMGTMARTGIAGVLMGNTAEKLLPSLPCSVLAIKPPGFTSPILLDSDESDED